MGDHSDICTFCSEVAGRPDSNLFYDLDLARRRDDYIIRETDHFVVIPCIGALTDFYVLIVAKRHTLSVGWLTDAEHTDLRTLITDISALLTHHSGHQCVVFEHGSYDHRDKGGACYDHTHIHIVATEHNPDDFLAHLPPQITLRPPTTGSPTPAP